MDRRAKVALIVAVAVAGLLRLCFSTFVVQWNAPIRGDETDYHTIATNLSTGDGFKRNGDLATGRPPVYAVVLSVVYRVFGAHVNVGRVLQILLGMLVVYLVFLTARKYFDGRVGLIAAAIAALNPLLIVMSAYLLTENLYTILVLTTLLVFPTPRRFAGPMRRVALAALLLGLAALTRPTGVPLGIWMLATGVLFGSGSVLRRSGNGLIAAAVFCVVLLPWCVRNYHAVGGWVGLTTHGGYTFYQGNNQKVIDVPHYRGGVAPLGALPHAAEISRMSQLERERFTWEKGKEFLRENWRQVPRLVWWKFARLWRLKSDAGLSGVKSGWWWDTSSFFGRLASRIDVVFLYAIVVFPLFIAGMILTVGRWRELLFPYGLVVAHTAVALVFFGSLRSRAPIEPVIAMFAAVTVDRLYRRFRRADQGVEPVSS